MKKLQCPLCETQLQQFSDIHDNYHVRVGCEKCKWTTFLCDPPRAWDAAEKFISLFPPFMRLRIGDGLEVKESSTLYNYFRVTEIYINSGIFWGVCVKTDEQKQFNFEEVSKWPWELKK